MRIEFPRGCHVEFPPVFPYKAEELQDENSGWWVVTYTEFIARTIASILFDVYDSLRLRAVSLDKCRLARDLNLKPVLGTMDNVNEAMRTLDVAGNTSFDTITVS